MKATLMRYRCHIGHAYTAEPMNIARDESVRRALGSSLRALRERIALAEARATVAGPRPRAT